MLRTLLYMAFTLMLGLTYFDIKSLLLNPRQLSTHNFYEANTAYLLFKYIRKNYYTYYISINM